MVKYSVWNPPPGTSVTFGGVTRTTSPSGVTTIQRPRYIGHTEPGGSAPPTQYVRRPTVSQQIARKASSTYQRLTRTEQARFVVREATKIDQYVKREAQKNIPTLRDIQMAGYKYGKAHPKQAAIVLSADLSLDIFAASRGTTRLGKNQSAKAFADGAIKGVRNEPIKTLAMYALPFGAGKVIKGISKIPKLGKIVSSPGAMKYASGVVGVVYTKLSYDFLKSPIESGKYTDEFKGETSKTLPNGDIEITQTYLQEPIMRKPTTNEMVERLGYIWGTELGPMALGSIGLKIPGKARIKKLTAKPEVKTIKKVTVNGKIKSSKTISKKTQLETDIQKARIKRVKGIVDKKKIVSKPTSKTSLEIDILKARINKVAGITSKEKSAANRIFETVFKPGGKTKLNLTIIKARIKRVKGITNKEKSAAVRAFEKAFNKGKKTKLEKDILKARVKRVKGITIKEKSVAERAFESKFKPSSKTKLEKDIQKARIKKVKGITKKAEQKFKVKKAIRKIEPVRRSVKQIQNKLSGIKTRYNNILKQKLPSRTVKLYNKIRAKEMELLFENNPTKRIKIQNELNSLINKITKEVGRKTIIKRIIDQSRRFLKDERAVTNLMRTGKKTTILEYTPKSEVMAFERSLKPTTPGRKLYTKEYETIFETGKVLPSIKNLQVIVSEPLPKVSTLKGLSSITNLPTGEIKLPSLNKQLSVTANMPKSLKTQIKSIKSSVTKFNKTTKELNANISKLKKLKKSLRTIKTRIGKIKLIKKIKSINIIIINLTKSRNKLSITIINKINSYRSSKTYKDYKNLIKPISKIKSAARPKSKTQVKTIVKPATKVVTKTKPRVITKPKPKPKPKPKVVKIPKVIPIILKPKKADAKKKKKKSKKKGIKEAFVKNPVPSLKRFIG